jgi:hypothetical protein
MYWIKKKNLEAYQSFSFEHLKKKTCETRGEEKKGRNAKTERQRQTRNLNGKINIQRGNKGQKR